MSVFMIATQKDGNYTYGTITGPEDKVVSIENGLVHTLKRNRHADR